MTLFTIAPFVISKALNVLYGELVEFPVSFQNYFFLFLRHSFSAFTAYRGRGLVNLQCHRLKSRDVSTRVVEENFRNVTSSDKEFGKFPKSTVCMPLCIRP